MKVMIPTNMDFDFNSARSSPHLNTPTTPKGFGNYFFSAPSSPTRLTKFYNDFDDFSVETSATATPFGWEEKPRTPKSPKSIAYETEFAFDVSEESEKTALPAEELFDGGKIRPIKPPPLLQQPRSQRSPISHIRGVFSPRKKKENPLATDSENTQKRKEEEIRGRERSVPSLSSSGSRRGTRARSLSPYRVSKYPWEEEEQQQQQVQQESTKQQQFSIIPKPALASSASKVGGSKKWRLKDFFLFRSASEGRATDKDPLKKYISLFKKHEDVMNSSFRSTEGSGSGSNSRRRVPVSAHELHYTMNKAVSNDLKKKTFLPYKQGILGRLAFNPAVHALSNGFGLSRK